jgi:hypothetical protein
MAVLLLGALQRPVLHAVVRSLLTRSARQAGLALQVQVSGNVWTHLQFSEIRLLPQTQDHPVLQSLECGRVEFFYSPLRMLGSGVRESILSYEIESLNLRLHSVRSESRAAQSARKTWVATLEKVLALPALYADRVLLRGVSVHIADGVPFKSLHNLSAGAYPDRPGRVDFEAIEFAPGHSGPPEWTTGGTATTSYAGRRLLIENLSLAADLRMERFVFDASERVHGRSRLEVRLASQTGHVRAALFAQKPGYAHLGGPTTRPLWRVELDAADFSLPSCLEKLGIASPTAPHLTWLEAHLEGDPREPTSWTGQWDVQAEHSLPHAWWGSLPLRSEAHASLEGGTLFARSTRFSRGPNVADLSGTLRLPPEWTRWRETKANLSLKADLRDLGVWSSAGKMAPNRGSCQAQGRITLQGGSLRCSVQAGAAAVAIENGSLEGASFSLEAWLPPGGLAEGAPPALSALSGRCALEMENACWNRGDTSLKADRFSLSLLASAGTWELQSANFRSGNNRAQVSASGDLFLQNPSPASAAAHLREARWEISAPTLETCGIRVLGHVLGGSLEARGNGSREQGTVRTPPALGGGRTAGGGVEGERHRKRRQAPNTPPWTSLGGKLGSCRGN